ncbi:hypothetical protein M1403_03190 [Patescibacteria group bacterium]|nr:hypothetical protein [Patescibacteria group bacterium]
MREPQKDPELFRRLNKPQQESAPTPPAKEKAVEDEATKDFSSVLTHILHEGSKDQSAEKPKQEKNLFQRLNKPKTQQP